MLQSFTLLSALTWGLSELTEQPLRFKGSPDRWRDFPPTHKLGTNIMENRFVSWGQPWNTLYMNPSALSFDPDQPFHMSFRIPGICILGHLLLLCTCINAFPPTLSAWRPGHGLFMPSGLIPRLCPKALTTHSLLNLFRLFNSVTCSQTFVRE